MTHYVIGSRSRKRKILWFHVVVLQKIMDRADFNWVSKVMRNALVLLCYSLWWFKTLRAVHNMLEISQKVAQKLLQKSRKYSTNQMQNQNQSRLGRTQFPALGAGHVYLLRVLIGSLCCLLVLWLAIVIALLLVLVLRHSRENLSNEMYQDVKRTCRIIARAKPLYFSLLNALYLETFSLPSPSWLLQLPASVTNSLTSYKFNKS